MKFIKFCKKQINLKVKQKNYKHMTNKQKALEELKKCIAYCREQNGLPSCKNCGLSEGMIEGIRAERVEWKNAVEDEIDFIIKRWDDMAVVENKDKSTIYSDLQALKKSLQSPTPKE